MPIGVRQMRPDRSASTTSEGHEMSGTQMAEDAYSTVPGVAPALEAAATQIREQAAAYCESSTVPGYLAGVFHDGADAVVAHGTANSATRAPMCEDTGFLFSNG